MSSCAVVIPIEPPDIPTAAPKAAATKILMVDSDTTIKPKTIKNKIQGKMMRIEKLCKTFSLNSTSCLLKYGKTKSIIGTKIKTQIKGETDQEGLMRRPSELDAINIKGVTR